MTLYQLWTEGTRRLSEAGNPEAELDAKRLLLEAFHTDLVHFLMNRMQQLEETEAVDFSVRDYREMIQKRCRRIPLQHILGNQEFMGLSFQVNSHVLIPRQDTETLVELVLEEHPEKDLRILDLCTGSGCIAISLAELGGYEAVTATDLSEEALLVASGNRDRLVTERPERLVFCQGDLFKAIMPSPDHQKMKEKLLFDVIVSNPPYIPSGVIRSLQPEVRDFEPRMALDGDEDGLVFYRRIAEGAGNYLKYGGSIYLEIGCDQGEDVSRLLAEQGFEEIRIVKDAPGKDRVVRAVLRHCEG